VHTDKKTNIDFSYEITQKYPWNTKSLPQCRHTHLEPSSSFENSPYLIMHFKRIIVILFAFALTSTHSKVNKIET
jgi:hypothetical protein